MRYGSINQWAKYFKKEEGVLIHPTTIRNKLKKIGITGIDLENGRNDILYPELDVREACRDLLKNLPQVLGDDGFLEKDGEKYGTILAFKKGLGISYKAIMRKIVQHSIPSIPGRIKGGPIHDFYPESVIRRVSLDLFEDLPEVDENGFFEEDGIKYGTIESWARELSLTPDLLKPRIAKMKTPITPKKGRVTGVTRYFYPESVIRKICSDLFEDLPEVNKEGFFEKDGVRYATIHTWSENLPICEYTVAARMSQSSAIPKKGKSIGHICDLYSEPQVREACSDILEELPKADESGFFEEDGIIYGTVRAFSKKLPICEPTIRCRIIKHSLIPKKGKDQMGRILNFYSEPAVRKACSNLLRDFPKSDKNGFIEIDGVRYGTTGAWMRELHISKEILALRLKKHPIKSKKGKSKGGQIYKYYPEPEIHEALRNHPVQGIACADILATKKSKK